MVNKRINEFLHKIKDYLSKDNDLFCNLRTSLKVAHVTNLPSLLDETYKRILRSPGSSISILTSLLNTLKEKRKISSSRMTLRTRNSNHNSQIADNISISSDEYSVVPKKTKKQQQTLSESSDSDVEIVTNVKSSDNMSSSPPGLNGTSRATASNVTPNPDAATTTNNSNNGTAHNNDTSETTHSSSNNVGQKPDIIEIDDSSDDDIKEIKFERNPPRYTNYSYNYTRCNFRSEPLNDSTILASYPFVLQFPTVHNRLYNGNLTISRNRNFIIKVDGIDPKNFRFNM